MPPIAAQRMNSMIIPIKNQGLIKNGTTEPSSAPLMIVRIRPIDKPISDKIMICVMTDKDT